LRIVVTGATGFIGSQVTAALVSAGIDVVGISRKQQPNKEVEWICADLLDQRQAADAILKARADRLIHLAWTVEHGKFWTDPANLAWAAASLGIAKKANEAGVQHITMCGTCFEYDWPTDQACDEESTPTAAHTLYDITKDACRRLIGAHAISTGYGFAWGRIFYVYGEAENPNRLVASVARSIVAGRIAKCSNGLAERDWMDVRDAGTAIARVSLSEFSGPINIASGEAATVRQVAQTIGEIAGRSELVAIGALPDRPEPLCITAKVGRLSSLGFKPKRTLLHGLSDALDYWKKRL